MDRSTRALAFWTVLSCLAACGSSDSGTTEGGRERPKNPYKVSTWVPVLDDPKTDSKEFDRAVLELEMLADPNAIPHLIRAWNKRGRPKRLLKVAIDLARPLTAKEATEKFLADYSDAGRPGSWPLVLPALATALDEIDPTKPGDVGNAILAAAALADARSCDARAILVAARERAKQDDVRAAIDTALATYREQRC
jgi:hypothetical protein